MSNLRHLPNVAAFQRGDLVTYHSMPMVVVFVDKTGVYADLFPGDDLAKVSAMGRVLTAVKLLARRDLPHFVTVEPVAPDDPAHYVSDWDVPPRLAIVEHRPGWPLVSYGTEGFVPLGEMREQARAVAARLGVEYREPCDELAVELLGAGA